MATRKLVQLTLALLLAGAAGCARRGGEPFNPLSALTPNITVEQERQVGAEADYKIRAQLYHQELMVDDPLVTGFINDLGQSLVRQLSEPRPFSYRFRVLSEPSLNAFALPGGYIYFHSGTILGAHNLDELAGVMAHEIAHSRRHHWARSVQATAVPNLISQIVGAGLTIATGEIAPIIVGQGISQGLRLAYTREFESEADTVGTAFMVRAGYDPLGMARFFERLMETKPKHRGGASLPPYLRSHPRTEVRAEEAAKRARDTTIPGREDPDIRKAFREVQLQLGLLVARGRSTLQPEWPTPDRAFVTRTLEKARAEMEAGARDAAIATLLDGEKREPHDPRLPFRRGEWLREAEQLQPATEAFGRVVTLDPETALAHYKLGETWYALGDKGRAIFYLEQAEGRFKRAGPNNKHTQEMLKRLTFPIVHESGLSDGVKVEGDRNTPGIRSVERFNPPPPHSAERIYWARIEPVWRDALDEMELRWIAPDGSTAHTSKLTSRRRGFAFAHWTPAADAARQLGIWQVELWFDEERVERKTFRVEPSDN